MCQGIYFFLLLAFLASPARSRAVLQVFVIKSSVWHSPPPHYHNHYQDNGYSDLLVGISPDVPESPEMLDQLKQILTNASASLFTATR